jgi:hypothetical protein
MFIGDKIGDDHINSGCEHVCAYNSVQLNVLVQLRVCESQDRQCMYKHNFAARSLNHFCSGEAKRITYSECVFVALGI